MNTSAVFHKSYFINCYPINDKELKVSLRTGKDIEGVIIIHEDPFTQGVAGNEAGWTGLRSEMTLEREMDDEYIWSIILKPGYKRLKYCFEIRGNGEQATVYEDGYRLEGTDDYRAGRYFIFPWINESDVAVTPDCVADTVWYQIFPDRFSRGNQDSKRFPVSNWECRDDSNYHEHFGGDLRGIINRLQYIADLGITGIYLNPIMKSDTNHKYGVDDYDMIDPDFGTEDDMKELVSKAHQMGIKVMVDAVFNHCGKNFGPWKDAVEKGPSSQYFNWFYINKWPFSQNEWNSRQGDFYTFAFVDDMPKLNTNNPAVANYLIERAKHWVTDWKIDAIRFDVGNEVAHSFVRKLRTEVKNIDPDIYLLGELWHDSFAWMMGDEYDSVMNYAFLEGVDKYFSGNRKDPWTFRFMIDRIYSMYYEQMNKVLFNILDSHDTGRLMDRCHNNGNVLVKMLTVLLTMQGSPCIYYGTEVGMNGSGSKCNRKCMPWDEIESNKYEWLISRIKALIDIRNQYPQTKSKNIRWDLNEPSGLIHYYKTKDGMTDLEVYINQTDSPATIIETGKIVFANGYNNMIVEPDGVVIRLVER